MKNKLFKMFLIGGLVLSSFGFVGEKDVEASVLSVSGVKVIKIEKENKVNEKVEVKVKDNKTVETLKTLVTSRGFKIENTKGYEGAVIKNKNGLIVLHVNTAKKVVFVNNTKDDVQKLGANVVKLMSGEKSTASNIYNKLNNVIKNKKVTKSTFGKLTIVETQNLQIEMKWK